MTIKDKACVVGIGWTEFHPSGEAPETTVLEMMCRAVLAAVGDAGLGIDDVDGFSFYGGGFDGGLLAQALGLPELRLSLTATGGGGGSQACVANAAAAVVAGYADVVVCVRGNLNRRIGKAASRHLQSPTTGQVDRDFLDPFGLLVPGQSFALLACRHMARYGTSSEQFGAVAVTTRLHASRNPLALRRDLITIDDHQNSKIVSEPLRFLDYCLESDGGTAVVVTSAERALDLPNVPVHLMAAAQGGAGRWGQGIMWHQMPDEYYASSGHREVAARLFGMAGVAADDIDVALLYDHFTPMVIMQLEDYGFCAVGEGGPFVEDGGLRWDTGRLPVNTHGGNLSESFTSGLSHTIEAVRQLRGTSTSQVRDAELALVTSGPGVLPTSAIILRR